MSQLNESIVLFAKDFFGDAIEADLHFLQNEEIAHATTFENGYTVISMPLELEPGVYDIVAYRDGGEYRINNVMISMASHYFRHSRLHGDLKLDGGNFDPQTEIESYKFDPLLYEYLSYLPEDAIDIFNDISKYGTGGTNMRWGGMIYLEKKLKVTRGAAIVEGSLVEWERTDLTIPEDIGLYSVGIKDKKLVISQETLDYEMAKLRKEGQDWVRLDVSTRYHPLYRNSKFIAFTDFETKARDVTMAMPSEEAIFGVVQEGKVYDTSRSSIPTTYVKLKVYKSGPVLSTNRLYVYATDSYFLLWEGPTLLVALPRWEGSYIRLEWDRGLTFTSWGSDGQTRWTNSRSYFASHVTFRSGNVPQQLESDLEKVIVGFQEIASHDFTEWDHAYKSSGATMTWNPYTLSPTPEP